MSEQAPPLSNPNLPSGYVSSEQLAEPVSIGPEILPWLKEPHQLNIARCEVAGSEPFLLASAIGTHDRLVAAADAMTPAQREIADKMFYSRIPPFMENKHSPSVETMADPSTSFSIHVMRNNGGQRVYFGVASLPLRAGEDPQPVVLRLGVCDKNKQSETVKVLSTASTRHSRNKKLR